MSQPYVNRYTKGEEINIASRRELEEFRREWKYHHPLSPEQLEWGSRHAVVEEVSFYHGGDVLYKLSDVPGLWHEAVLYPVTHT